MWQPIAKGSVSHLLGGERDGGVGIGSTEINLSQLLRKTLFFLYYNLAGLFSRGCLTEIG